MVDTCLFCGGYIPEGKHVCSTCELKHDKDYIQAEIKFKTSNRGGGLLKEFLARNLAELLGVRRTKRFDLIVYKLAVVGLKYLIAQIEELLQSKEGVIL